MGFLMGFLGVPLINGRGIEGFTGVVYGGFRGFLGIFERIKASGGKLP